MESKKSQQALEFLMTYGWTILVVLIAIGALAYLAYFGVFGTENWKTQRFCEQEPDKCVCEKNCNDWYSEGNNKFNPPKDLIRKCDLNKNNNFEDTEKLKCISKQKKTQDECVFPYNKTICRKE